MSGYGIDNRKWIVSEPLAFLWLDRVIIKIIYSLNQYLSHISQIKSEIEFIGVTNERR